MKLRTIILYFALFGIASIATAVVIMPFRGWERLAQKSSDVIVVRCSKTPDPLAPDKDGVSLEIIDGIVDSDMEIVSILKGGTNSGNVRVSSEYWPRQRECYLIFADFHDGYYQAVESYRVVPLGINFPTNLLTGKSLEEQIRTALKYRLDNLDRKMKEEMEEKQRLEEGLKK